MKKLWMLAGVLMATSASAQEQETEEAGQARNVVALDVAGLLQDSIGVSAERAVAQRVSARLGLRVGLNARWTRDPWAVSYTGRRVESLNERDLSFALEPGARLFLTGRAPEGFWMGPQVGLKLGWTRSTFELEGSSEPADFWRSRFLVASAGALAGYSAILGKSVSLQAAAGLNLSYERPLGGNDTVGPAIHGSSQWALQPLTQLSLGYAF